MATAVAAAEVDPAALVEQGHHKRARALLEKRLAANPEEPDALVLMARVKLAYNDPGGAKNLLQRAIAVQPKNSSAHFVLADAYSRRVNEAGLFEKIKIAKAIRSETDEALAVDPKNVDAMASRSPKVKLRRWPPLTGASAWSWRNRAASRRPSRKSRRRSD
jgi:cytochrome c-type biogenesis protein CcmH/NrfG